MPGMVLDQCISPIWPPLSGRTERRHNQKHLTCRHTGAQGRGRSKSEGTPSDSSPLTRSLQWQKTIGSTEQCFKRLLNSPYSFLFAMREMLCMRLRFHACVSIELLRHNRAPSMPVGFQSRSGRPSLRDSITLNIGKYRTDSIKCMLLIAVKVL